MKYWCHFNATLPGTSLDLFSVYRPTYELAAVDPVFTENLFKLLVRSYHEYQAPVAAPDKFEAEGALRLLLAPFVRTIPAIQGGPAFSSDKISGMILYLEDNLHRRLSLKELGAEFKLNPTCLSNLFREKMGVPLMNYRNKRRIERAVELLWNTTFNISEIADKVGFPNVSSFSKAFSAQTGHSPREYRRLLSR